MQQIQGENTQETVLVIFSAFPVETSHEWFLNTPILRSFI